MRGLKKIIAAIGFVMAVCILLLILSIAVSFKTDSIVQINAAGKHITFKKASALNFSVFIKNDKKALLGFKILRTGFGRLHSLDVIREAGNEYILYADDNRINIFNAEGKSLFSRKIDTNKRVVSVFAGEITNDKNDEILFLTGNKASEYGDTLTILSDKTGSPPSAFSPIYKHTFKGLNPWKVQTSDVDNDGWKEISLGVYKTSKFHPVLAKRPFFYNWTGSGVTPKWLGSRLSRPFDDYILLDINSDGADELVSIEKTGDGKKVINSYTWKGFGFEGIGESQKFSDIFEVHGGTDFQTGNRCIISKVKENNKIHWYKFLFASKKGIIKKKEIKKNEAINKSKQALIN